MKHVGKILALSLALAKFAIASPIPVTLTSPFASPTQSASAPAPAAKTAQNSSSSQIQRLGKNVADIVNHYPVSMTAVYQTNPYTFYPGKALPAIPNDRYALSDGMYNANPNSFDPSVADTVLKGVQNFDLAPLDSMMALNPGEFTLMTFSNPDASGAD